MRNDLFYRLEKSKILQKLLNVNPESEKKELTEDEKKEKRNRTLNGIMAFENPYKEDNVKLFDAELLNLRLWSGTIVTTYDYFVFLSFGLKTDDSEKFKSNQFDCRKTKKKLIYRWSEIEEIMVKPFFGPMIGIEI
jgi:hypothetical protein